MDKPRLIDGQALLDWLDVEIDLSSGQNEVLKVDKWAFQHVKKAIQSGRFSSPSVSYRLREALKRIANYQRDQYESPLYAYDECKRIACEALSITTEPTGAE